MVAIVVFVYLCFFVFVSLCVCVFVFLYLCVFVFAFVQAHYGWVVKQILHCLVSEWLCLQSTQIVCKHKADIYLAPSPHRRGHMVPQRAAGTLSQLPLELVQLAPIFHNFWCFAVAR